MPIQSALTANQVRNSASTEVEFSLLSSLGTTREFRCVTEPFNKPHRLHVKTMEEGVGLKRVRSTMIRVSKTVTSDVDATIEVVPLAQIVVKSPTGALTTNAEPLNCLAELGSLIFSIANSTLVLDGSTDAQKALLNGDI